MIEERVPGFYKKKYPFGPISTRRQRMETRRRNWSSSLLYVLVDVRGRTWCKRTKERPDVNLPTLTSRVLSREVVVGEDERHQKKDVLCDTTGILKTTVSGTDRTSFSSLPCFTTGFQVILSSKREKVHTPS